MTADMSYRRPPIVEAVIELRFTETISFELCGKAAGRLTKTYPVDEADLNFVHRPDLAGGIQMGMEPFARRLSSDDRSQIVLVRRDGVIFANRAPYPGWREFSDRSAKDYSRLKEELGNRAFGRLGVRYINRIDVPINLFGSAPNTDLTRLLNIVPPKLPFGGDAIQAFAVQVQTQWDELYSIVLSVATTDAIVPETFAILLDVDVFREVDVPRRDDEIWAALDHMREIKNTVFENCITDSTRRLFS